MAGAGGVGSELIVEYVAFVSISRGCTLWYSCNTCTHALAHFIDRIGTTQPVTSAHYSFFDRRRKYI